MKPKKTRSCVQPPAPELVSPEVVAEEKALFVKTLKTNRQLADEGKRLPPGATHQVARDAQGRQQVVRRRFSAV
jgi:hypothetical protein